MKKLLRLIACALFLNALPAYALFEDTKQDITLKVADCSVSPEKDFLPKIGVLPEECNPLLFNRFFFILRTLGFYPTELDITNNSTKTYRLSINSVLGKCQTDYTKLHSQMGQLPIAHMNKEAGAIITAMLGSYGATFAFMFSLDRKIVNKTPAYCAMALGLAAIVAGFVSLFKLQKDAQAAGKAFESRYVLPEHTLIKPGQRVKKFIFLTAQGYSQSDFTLSLVNHEQPDDILSFKVAIKG